VNPTINNYNQRIINNQQTNFNKGVVNYTKNGQLNKAEFMALTRYDQETRELEGKYMKDGELSFQERQALENRNKYNQKILKLYSRGDYNPVSKGPQNDIERRMDNQLSRTYDGLKDGSLTRNEGYSSLDYQGETATLHGKYKATPDGFWNKIMGRGTFTGGERRAINNRLNYSNRQLYNMKNNWARDWGSPDQANLFQPKYAPHYHGGRPPYRPIGQVGVQNYRPPVNFPSPSLPPMYTSGCGSNYGMPGFSGGMPPYMSQLCQGLFSGMGMGAMMGMGGYGMMGMMGMGFMMGGMMPMNMRPFRMMSCRSPLQMSGPHSSACGMAVNDKNMITTRGGYQITYKGTDVIMKDPKTGKWTKVWGDPHVKTSDGDNFDWKKKTATFVLPDGTKMTMNAENKDGVVKGLDVYDPLTNQHVHGDEGQYKSLSYDAFQHDRANTDGQVFGFKGGSMDDVAYLDYSRGNGFSWHELNGSYGENYGGGGKFWNPSVAKNQSGYVPFFYT